MNVDAAASQWEQTTCVVLVWNLRGSRVQTRAAAFNLMQKCFTRQDGVSPEGRLP